MEWLNYHHLLYFWTVARHGSVTKASEELRLAQPTVSGQIRTLEEALGEKLFSRVGRNLVLTEMGQVVFDYADEIFSLGRELMHTVKGRPTGKPQRVRVGITNLMPKLIAYRLLEPALAMDDSVQLLCYEDRTSRLLGDLAVRGLDLVLADAPLPSGTPLRAFNHLLGESGITFFAADGIYQSHRRRFPRSLNGARMLLPSDNTTLRRSLEQWFSDQDVHPNTIAEFDDSGLLKVFGEYGAGIFPAPTVVEKEIRETYGVGVVGRTQDIVEKFYAITVERRIKHPAVMAISEAAKDRLFGR